MSRNCLGCSTCSSSTTAYSTAAAATQRRASCSPPSRRFRRRRLAALLARTRRRPLRRRRRAPAPRASWRRGEAARRSREEEEEGSLVCDAWSRGAVGAAAGWPARGGLRARDGVRLVGGRAAPLLAHRRRHVEDRHGAVRRRGVRRGQPARHSLLPLCRQRAGGALLPLSRCRLAARRVVPLLITTLLGCCQVLAPPSGATESPLAARWAENLATLLASRIWRVHGACTTRPRHVHDMPRRR